MVSAPRRQSLGCPACGGSFVVHLFFSDFAGEPHKQGRCPWCAYAGAAPTGTAPVQATFRALAPPTNDGVLELALSSACASCGAFLVDDDVTCVGCGAVSRRPSGPGRARRSALSGGITQLSASDVRDWERRLSEPKAWKLIYTEERRLLTVDADGAAELRERGEPTFYRGRYEPGPLEVRVWRGRVRTQRARHIADLLVYGPPTAFQLIPDEYPAGVRLEHREASHGVSFMHSVTSSAPSLREAHGMLESICRELEARPPAKTEPNTTPQERAHVAPVKVKPVVAPKIDPIKRATPEPVVTPKIEPLKRATPEPVFAPKIEPVAPPKIEPVAPPKIAPTKRATPEPVKPPPVQIPDDECAACDARSPFAGRVEERDGAWYAVYRCPSCREDFTVYEPSRQGQIDAWIEENAAASGASVEDLIAEVLRDPRADQPRIRFAAVVARVDPLRAALVLAQLAAARLSRRGQAAAASGFHARSAGFLADRARLTRWYAGVDGLVPSSIGSSSTTTRHLQFRRGFVEGICVTARQFVEKAAPILRLAPVIDVAITALGAESEALFSSPHGSKLRSLCLYNTGATDADVRRLAESPHFARLSHLDLGACRITNEGVEALCASKRLPALRFVRLLQNPCDDPNPTFDEKDGQRRGLIATARAAALREAFGRLPWLNDRYSSHEPPDVEAFP